MIGTAGFHFIEHWSWFDGFYMVLTTLTTIGYGEVHPLSQAGRYFNVAIILAGVGLVFLILGAFGQALLEFEFNNLFGRRRMEREIARLKGHYIICGAGRVGRAVARQLESKPAQFVILESNEVKAERIRAETNWLIVHADATLEAQLARRAYRPSRRTGGRNHHRRHQHLRRADRAQFESGLEDHCPRQRRGRGEAHADRRCRPGGFALQFCRISHRARRSSVLTSSTFLRWLCSAAPSLDWSWRS